MSIVLSHLGKDAYKIYAKAKPQERENILNVLSDLEANKEALKLYFTPKRCCDCLFRFTSASGYRITSTRFGVR